MMETVYTPSELNHEARLHLEAGFGRVWVEGEISNLGRPSSGHIYFSLKDDRAQISCALFRSNARGLGFVPENGMQVRAHGRVSLYEARGNYQLIADMLQQAGEGALQARFEQLKKALAAEGLFDERRKKPLPAFPRRVAVVTSPSGAAIRDVVTVLGRRWPLAEVRVYGVPVQGDEAAPAIAEAIRAANVHGWAEVIITGRGGGSLEDLWAFNEEVVARAIHASGIPVVSAVGHETDFSIADFAADLRAPTPSAAAELVSPDAEALRRTFATIESRLQRFARQRLQNLSQALDHLAHRLAQRHPGQRLRQHRELLQRARQRLFASGMRMVPERRRALAEMRQRLLPMARRLVPDHRQKLAELVRTLNALSPLPTLARGYAIVTDDATGAAITSVRHVSTGDKLRTQLSDGQVISTVDDTNDSSLDSQKIKSTTS
jgi:exodeoxyribonuclease VII large subunit